MVVRWLSARLPRRRSAKPVRRYLDADQPRCRALAATGTVSADGFDLVAGRAFVRLHRRDHLNGGNDASLDHEPFCGVDSDNRWDDASLESTLVQRREGSVSTSPIAAELGICGCKS